MPQTKKNQDKAGRGPRRRRFVGAVPGAKDGRASQPLRAVGEGPRGRPPLGLTKRQRRGPLPAVANFNTITNIIFCFCTLFLVHTTTHAQIRAVDRNLLGLPEYNIPAPRFAMEHVAPEIHKWYAPRHLAESYMRPWYITNTQHGRQVYRRYVDQILEGDDWYDTFGSPLGRGWLVYNWQQQQPLRNGSQLLKDSANFNSVSPYRAFFQSLVIANDSDSGGTYRLIIGDRIFTTFTPLTLYKPNFDGIRVDYATDRYATSLLLSRPSSPGGGDRSNVTHFMAGHLDLQASPQAKVGLTYINAHNVQTQTDFSYGNPLRGGLTTSQNQPLNKIWVRLRDDSPEDGIGGATLFRHEIVLIDSSGRRLRGRTIGLLPRIEGGLSRDGALVADGLETILLEYDLLSLDRRVVEAVDLERVYIELVVANDYHIEMASDRQNNGDRLNPEIVFLTKSRAPGNVQDESNGRLLKLDYGLPTANELLGVNWDLVDWGGLSIQGEAVLNQRYGKYPGPEQAHHHLVVDRAGAGYINMAYNRYPWALFGEAFSIADAYATNYWLTQSSGEIRFKAPVPDLYEFVDDDDDHDAIPEWERPFQLSSRQVAWPGYDENRDFLYDHNQNANLVPDYEEPFLRFRSDRPDFLFGLDMNHNGTPDRLENDLLPDYPYKRDHRGFNTYLRAHGSPNASLSLGWQRLQLISGDGRTHSLYALASWTRALVGGRLRLFEFGALVKDNIRDDLQHWVQPIGAIGRMQDLPDVLPARNTWKNTLYLDLDQRLGDGLRLQHRFKWDLLRQRQNRETLRLREGRRTSGFIGLIDKVEWSIPIGLAILEPRLKSEFRRDRPFSTRRPTATSLEETAILMWIQPILAEQTSVNYYPRYGRQIFSTALQTGIEFTRFWMLQGSREEIDQDFRDWTFIAQLTNRVAYTGYQLVFRAGARWNRRHFAEGQNQRSTSLFMSVHAGLE